MQTLTFYLYKVFNIDIIKKTNIRYFITIKQLLKIFLKYNYNLNIFTIIKLKYIKNLTRSRKSIQYDFIKKTIIIIINKLKLSLIRLQFIYIYNIN